MSWWANIIAVSAALVLSACIDPAAVYTGAYQVALNCGAVDIASTPAFAADLSVAAVDARYDCVRRGWLANPVVAASPDLPDTLAELAIIQQIHEQVANREISSADAKYRYALYEQIARQNQAQQQAANAQRSAAMLGLGAQMMQMGQPYTLGPPAPRMTLTNCRWVGQTWSCSTF